MKGQIESMKTTYEISYQKKSQFEEEKKEMAEQLKSQQKQAKKNREIVTELQKLSGQDLRILQNQVGELKKELDVLQEEWKEYKKPLTDEINEQKQDITDKKVEYQYKMDKIKDIKKEIKDTIQDLEHKKELLVYLQNQWEKLPQDVNRNQYLKRINEIIANLKAQKVEIKNILGEITDIQKDTDALIEQIKKLDVEVEDYIFNEAKKDKIAKEIYKEITQLKDDFDKLTTNIQEQNKLKSTIREIETKSEDFRIKYKNGVEIQKLVEDLNGIKGENAALQADL
jgi:chromosome segregation ATPase